METRSRSTRQTNPDAADPGGFITVGPRRTNRDKANNLAHQTSATAPLGARNAFADLPVEGTADHGDTGGTSGMAQQLQHAYRI